MMCAGRCIPSLVVALTLWVSPCAAFVEVAARVDTASGFIGDIVTYEVLVTYDGAHTVEKLPHGENLSAFHIRKHEPIEKKKLQNGLWQEGSRYEIAAYRPGLYVIPPLPVKYSSRAG